MFSSNLMRDFHRQKTCLYLLAFAKGMFHTVASEFLVVVDKGEGQVYVKGVGSVRSCSPLS